MKTIFLTLAIWSLAISAQAAALYWDSPTTGTVTIEYSATETGPFTVIATNVQAAPKTYPIVTGKWGFYRVSNAAGISNLVKYSLDMTTPEFSKALTDLGAQDQSLFNLIGDVSRRVTGLETPAPPTVPASNLTTRTIDADHLEIIGGNCLSLRTTGSGLRRVVECVH